MLPIIALVGRPNVGKSTLFNALMGRRHALVVPTPGATRDRHYAKAEFNDKSCLLVDTGGMGEANDDLDVAIVKQAQFALDEADLIVFVLDARQGLTPADESLSQQLRRQSKPILCVVNKMEQLEKSTALADFQSLGLGNLYAVAAEHRMGIETLWESLSDYCLPTIPPEDTSTRKRVAIIGRPNVGKSTLINRILGEERMVVSERAGTTSDSIYIPYQRNEEDYLLIDTAGIRRRARSKEALEAYSVVKSLQAIDQAQVVLALIDAQEGIVEQDLHLLGTVLESGRSLIIAVNKWDHVDERAWVKSQLERRLHFVEYAKVHFISALHGTGVGDLFASIKQAHRSALQQISTPEATDLLERAVTAHPPPLVRGRRIKLRYAHMGGQNPPLIVIHGNQTDALPGSYKRYLENFYRNALKLVGTPIKIECRTSDNPFKGRRNTLTPRQMRKRKRVIRKNH